MGSISHYIMSLVAYICTNNSKKPGAKPGTKPGAPGLKIMNVWWLMIVCINQHPLEICALESLRPVSIFQIVVARHL